MEFLAQFFDFRAFLLLALVFIPLEQLLPERADQKVFRRGWLNDLVYVLFNGILIRVGLLIVIVAIVMLSDWIIPAGFKAAVAAQPIWLQAGELIILADLGFYGMHRLFHAVPLLWRFHAVHHSIEEMDWLAGHRVHPVDQILTKAASMVPCFALGFSEWAIAIYFIIYSWHSVLLHANTRLSFGPLRWLIASPAFHHWHHANQREAYDKNFAAQLPLWDLIFKTSHMPAGEVPERYGVDDPVPATYIEQLVYPFRDDPRRADAPLPPAQADIE